MSSVYEYALFLECITASCAVGYCNHSLMAVGQLAARRLLQRIHMYQRCCVAVQYCNIAEHLINSRTREVYSVGVGTELRKAGVKSGSV